MRNIGNNKGFTLVELLVAMLVFSLIIGAASNLLFSSIASQRRILATQSLITQTSFIQEYVSRSIRQAKKELSSPAVCLTTSGRGYNYEITHSGSGILFIDRQNRCREFFLENGRIKEGISGVEQYITPDELVVLSFNFTIRGESQIDNLQPRVTFFLDMTSVGVKAESQASIQTQTTISQRKVDILE